MEWSTPNPGSIASDHLPLSVIGFVPGCWTIMMAPIPLYFLRGLYLWASHIFTTPSALGKYSATSKPGKSMKVSPQRLAGHFRDQTKGVLLCYSMVQIRLIHTENHSVLTTFHLSLHQSGQHRLSQTTTSSTNGGRQWNCMAWEHPFEGN